MRSIWKGLISFGLVNIPVALYPAVEDKQLHFHQLHKEDGGRIGHQQVCKVCGKSLEAEEIVRGYEYEKNSYVTLADEDFDKRYRNLSMPRPSTRSTWIKPTILAPTKPGRCPTPCWRRP